MKGSSNQETPIDIVASLIYLQKKYGVAYVDDKLKMDSINQWGKATARLECWEKWCDNLQTK